MLYHRERGQGEPLLLIHGLFGASDNLGALALHLQEFFKVYSLDLPNHGRSDHQSGMDLKAMALAVHQWMNTHHLSNVCLVGHSLGGKVAMEVALEYPDDVKSLVVMDIAPVQYAARHDNVFDGMQAVCAARVSTRDEANRVMLPFVPEDAVRSFLLKNLSKQGTGFSWRFNLADLKAQYPNLIQANCEGVFTGDTLFLKGGNSDYLLPEYREAIVSRFPAAEFKVVANTGHWLHAEKPQLVARLVRKFLASSD